jgi:SNF2 family DNA or RNA helicase/HJR/Mrr/RecB family endonuclease
MLSGIFKKEFNLKSSFTSDGVLTNLYDKKDNLISLPLDKKIEDELYRWEPQKLKMIQSLEQMIKSMGNVEFSEKLIREFSTMFSENDLTHQSFSISNGGILSSYKAISALRFNGLSEELGYSSQLFEMLMLPEYSKVRIEIKTKGSFSEPVFKIEYLLFDEKNNRLYIKDLVGHCLTTDRGEQLFLSPSLKMLIVRLEEHNKIFNDGEMSSDLNLRYKEFSQVKELAKNANAVLDNFTKDFENIYVEELSYILGRDCDQEVIIQEALPVELSGFDQAFVLKLGNDCENEMPSKLILKNAEGKTIFVTLSPKAWGTQRKLRKLQAEGQDKLEEVLDDPSKFLDGVERTALEDTFSDRVSGFIFGKPKPVAGESRQGGQWADASDDTSLLIRDVGGTAIEIETKPMPKLYVVIKESVDKLIEAIDDHEINLRIQNHAYLTPLPPEKDKLIYIKELDAEFNLRTLVNTCKRIEAENVPEVFEDQIEEAKETISIAVEAKKVAVKWKKKDKTDLDDLIIPVESLKSALPKEIKESVDSVSLNIDDDILDSIVLQDLSLGMKDIEYVKPPNLKDEIELFLHQKIGYTWLKSLFDYNVDNENSKRIGALLADDMGLGKTIQVISLISYIKSDTTSMDKPILIVAPVSLLDGSWINEGLVKFVKEELIKNGISSTSKYEIRNFSKCPYRFSKKAMFHEATLLNDEMVKDNKTILECDISTDLREYLDNIKKWCGSNIVVTSYETLRSKSIELGCVDFSLVVLDEAQKIKNHGTLQSNASRALKAEMSIAMTGTPIENSIMDLYSIMDFVSPMKLGTRDDFRAKYLTPLNHSPAGSDERMKLKDDLLIDLKPLWLRRNKKDVFKVGEEIPEIYHHDQIETVDDKYINTDAVKMSEDQYTIYKDQVGLFQNAKKGHKLAALRGMLEACYSPWLSKGSEVSWSNKEELFLLCPKLKQTFKILDSIYRNTEEEGRKVILFANVIQVQNSLAWLIRDWIKSEKGESIEIEVYNGIPTPQVRIQMLERFKNSKGFHALIISPRAGGAGLNIQFANHVIHYTREWNPALEKQATDRVYRIGQKRPVHVHYPTTISNVDNPSCAEEELANILAAKRDVMDDFTMVSQDIGFDEFEGSESEKTDTDNILIGVGDLKTIDDKQFEGFVACMFSSLGYKTTVSGQSGDRGVDVVCIGDKENYLVQVKQTKSKRNIHSSCIDEVRGGKSFYESKLGKKFKLVVVTNSHFHEGTFTASTIGDPVELWNIDKILMTLGDKSFSLSEINRKAKGN